MCKDVIKTKNNRTKNFKIEIGTIFKDEKRDLTIIDREYRKCESNGQNFKYYRYRCNKCGWDEGWVVEHDLINGQNCTCCGYFKKTPILGFNTIWDTDRWMCDLGVSEEDAKKYTRCSGQKINVKCPHCGIIKEDIKISNIYNNHSISCFCSDNISYPEKIMFSVLTQLNVEFETQKIFDWSKKVKYKNPKLCGDKYYDFLINTNCVIETHGIQHYEKSNRGRRTLIEEQENDRFKKELALQNGIKEENYIVIDCRESNLEYIKNNIIQSKLSKLFDLSNINWNKCEEFALNNLVKTICGFKENNNDLSSIQISKIMKLCVSTIIKYLKKGTKLGWCNYDPKEEIRKNGMKNGVKNSKPLKVFKNNLCIGTFKSCAELEKQSEELFGVKLNQSNISQVCNGKVKLYKGFMFKYI